MGVKSTFQRRGTGWLQWLTLALVLARCAWIFSLLLRAHGMDGGPPLHLAQDDLFYYIRPAENLAWHGRSTFFENVLTNGYHPLYFLVLSIVFLGVHSLAGAFRFLWLLDTGSALALFLLARRLFARVASPWLANGLALLLTALSISMICDQMEVTLALPLGFAFLLGAFCPPSQLNARRAAWTGLAGAFLFLARLDAALLVLLYVVAVLLAPSYRRALRAPVVASFAAAFLPLPLLYLALNRWLFGTWLPISGMAKELRHGHTPSVLVPLSFSGTSEVLIFAAIGTAVLAWALRRRLRPEEAVFLAATLTTPFLFYAVEMVLSDWQLWNWYFYVLRFAAAGSAMLFAVWASRGMVFSSYTRLRRLLQSNTFGGLVYVLTALLLLRTHYKIDDVMVEIEHAASTLHAFAQTHPGVYAMGDRAGMFSITTTRPVLQTEGLMMDRAYLEHIRAGDNLRTTLQHYGVQYYVAFIFKKNLTAAMEGGCFHAAEPAIAGPSALRMRALFCGPPLARFAGDDGQYVIYAVGPSS